jgi:hypothetical protein
MKPLLRTSSRFLAPAFAVVAGACLAAGPGDAATEGNEIPAALAPLEFLVGRWNGQGVPKDHAAVQFRGWSESHSWVWIFTKGKPTGLAFTFDKDKVLASGKLRYDSARKRYRLEATAPQPAGSPIAFEGALDSSGKRLVLEQTESKGAGGAPRTQGTWRLSLWPNSNFVRYTLAIDRREAGAVQFSHAIEVGLTREGEAFAATSTTTERPKCIVTGGAATMTLTYQDRTFPICCTGCRDEFNENPEKYLKKASLMAQSQAGRAQSNQPAPARVSRFDDAFASDVVETPAMKGKGTSNEASRKAEKPGTALATVTAADAEKVPKKSTAKKDREKPAASQPSSRSAGWLQIGQNLEKNGKTDAALGYYRRIVKEYPNTPAAKTAAQRIKALDQP